MNIEIVSVLIANFFFEHKKVRRSRGTPVKQVLPQSSWLFVLALVSRAVFAAQQMRHRHLGNVGGFPVVV